MLNESQISTLQSPTSKMGGMLHLSDISTNPVVDQLAKEKSDVENKYNDLFTAYNSLLLHNKAISEKLQKADSRADLPPAPHKGSDSASKRSHRDSSSKLRVIVKDHTKKSPSPAQRKLTVSAEYDSLRESTHEKSGTIRRNSETKRNKSLCLSIDEPRKKDTEISEVSSTRHSKHPPLPKQFNSSRKALEVNQQKVIDNLIAVAQVIFAIGGSFERT